MNQNPAYGIAAKVGVPSIFYSAFFLPNVEFVVPAIAYYFFLPVVVLAIAIFRKENCSPKYCASHFISYTAKTKRLPASSCSF